ncbi:MAG TPA: hypothetical protein VGO11_18255 [Chthoniobacteraceae bacterium]|jgi:hypothetical protein|nr:hypothetical protein [Chthoniobacteraceae bacterium]
MVFLHGLPKRVRARLMDRIDEIPRFPDHFSQFQERDSIGRTLDVAIIEGYAVYYWNDFADRHIKVMAIARELHTRPDL